jgi:DNA-binding NarL/FixJ family response regulator
LHNAFSIVGLFARRQELVDYSRACFADDLVPGIRATRTTDCADKRPLVNQWDSAARRDDSIERPETPIIFITGNGDVRTTVQAMKAGAFEFLTKPFRDHVMLGAIREALERSRIALGHEAEMSVLRDCYASLSPRERQVMALVVSGLLNKQVGGELGISEITVKAHRGKVMQKMKAESLPDLVKMAGRLGLAWSKA